MKIEDQVVSLELAKQLKEIGIKQDSIWYWVEHYKSGTNKIIWSLYQNDEDDIVNKHISAYTFAEISSMLPATLECNDDPYEPCDGIYIQTRKEKDGTWNCDDGNYCAKSKRIADAPAKMILYLLSEDCYYDDLKFLEWKNSILNKRVTVPGIK